MPPLPSGIAAPASRAPGNPDGVRAIGYALRRKDAPPEEVSIAAHHLQTIHKTT